MKVSLDRNDTIPLFRGVAASEPPDGQVFTRRARQRVRVPIAIPIPTVCLPRGIDPAAPRRD